MHGIPRVPGRRAYSSVGREVGAVCGERLAVFVPVYSRHSVALCKKRLASESGFLFGSSYGFVVG